MKSQNNCDRVTVFVSLWLDKKSQPTVKDDLTHPSLFREGTFMFYKTHFA